MTFNIFWALISGFDHITEIDAKPIPQDLEIIGIETDSDRDILTVKLFSSEFKEVPDAAGLETVPVSISNISQFEKAVVEATSVERKLT